MLMQENKICLNGLFLLCLVLKEPRNMVPAQMVLLCDTDVMTYKVSISIIVSTLHPCTDHIKTTTLEFYRLLLFKRRKKKRRRKGMEIIYICTNST